MLLKDRAMHDKTSPAGRLERQAPPEKSRMDRLVQYADYCESAKEVAEAMGDTFLAYMMAMSIQAARTQMRPKIAGPKR
jgi:hypothetical protein